MTNVLNNAILNQTTGKKPVKKINTPAFVFDSKGAIKPLEAKGVLLPSKIFDSPVTIAKDLKQDVVSIGKAFKGEANDHELGRINDFAMKLGSLGLASYLFVKNPLKLSKTMEFVGLGTFFASMSLWPKLAIQAPLKARTGVDIHQKYVDSQGRKKMLHQDPQYDLTDMYSRKDLDRMGKKLKVSENLPDRDNFIKQRAKKTAIQGNTLWMMTAGFATPLMSALACDKLGKPINNLFEKMALSSTEKAMEEKVRTADEKLKISERIVNFVEKMAKNSADKKLNKFLAENANKKVDSKMIDALTDLLGSKIVYASLGDEIGNELKAIQNNTTIDDEMIKKVLNSLKFSPDILTKLTEEKRNTLNEAITEESFVKISNVLSEALTIDEKERKKISNSIKECLKSEKTKATTPTVSDLTGKIRQLHGLLDDYVKDNKVLNKFIEARVGDKSGTYIANQWGRVSSSFINSLELSESQLKSLRTGTFDDVVNLLSDLAKNPKKEEQYNKIFSQLVEQIADFEEKAGSGFLNKVQNRLSKSNDTFANAKFNKIADKLRTDTQKGSLRNIIEAYTKERSQGAQSSFYRLAQTLDFFKREANGTLKDDILNAFSKYGDDFYKNLDDANKNANVSRITELAKKFLLDTTIVDCVKKLTTQDYQMSKVEYQVLIDVLYGCDDKLEGRMNGILPDKTKLKHFLSGLKTQKDKFMDKVANWENDMSPDLKRYVVNGVSKGTNSAERSALVAKSAREFIQDGAKNIFNSKKWLKIFGGSMIALTAITLVAGLAIGRKTKIEKQLEQEGRANG